MIARLAPMILPVVFVAIAGEAVAADGDTKRGAALYRACVACHSLEPGVHLSGPSLADMWDKPAGKVDGFMRYSKELKSADFAWSAETLFAWIADPKAMAPGTYMTFRGIENAQSRADLVAFLKIAMAPDGAKTVVEKGLVSEALVRGPQPEPLSPVAENVRVTAMRHCGDSYFIATADGRAMPFWEMNVRLKIDTRSTGPEPGKPVVAGAGMQGDRISVIFSSIEEMKRIVEEKC